MTRTLLASLVVSLLLAGSALAQTSEGSLRGYVNELLRKGKVSNITARVITK
jgi:hypothetical protein